MSRCSLLVLLIALVACAGPPPPPEARAKTPVDKEDIAPEAATGTRTGLTATRGDELMVGAAHPEAAAAGLAMLRAGGSAVDAAIAMGLVLTLVEPQSSGIGGGAFMLRYDAASHEVVAYDGRETAPASAKPDMFMRGGKPRDFFDAVIGGLSVGVPGELRMFEMAHRAHGKLPWKQLFAPAIALADKGFVLSPRLFGLLKRDPFLAQMAKTRQYFLSEGGEPKPVGTLIKNPELAAVLRAVAEEGADAFYTGPIARDIAAAVAKAEKNPAALVEADLASYRPHKRPAICRPYRKYQVCGMPPPTSGGITTLQILGLLERFELASYPAGSVTDVHLLAEAGKLAYADRDRYIADPDFVDVPVAGLLDADYLAKRSRSIALGAAMPKASPGVVETKEAWALDRSDERPSTTHVVAVDAAGNAVSMTASIEGAFGSHVMVRGFLLNNELTDFSFVPEVDQQPVANRVEPGKRPRSSMSPIIVKGDDGRLVMVVGSPGGSRIIGYVARVLVAVLDHGQDIQAAIAAPHFLNRNGPTELEEDVGLDAWVTLTRSALEELGHEVVVGPQNSGLHGIMRTEEGLLGGADPRREGVILAE